MEGQRPPPMLDELPPEIHTGIGSRLSGRELDGVTRASKRLRALFLRSIFRRVRFDSTQPEVTRSLDLFVNGRSAEDMSCILAAVRSASFILPLSELLDVFSPEEMLPVSLDPLRLQILRAIRLVSQVRHLTVDLELFGDGHVQTFRNALPSIPRLERLRIEHPFPPLNENHFPAMQYIYESRESLRHVKWLAIAEKNPGDTGSMDAFEQCFEEILEALQQMPALLRFAFTLDINRFQPDEVRDSLGLPGSPGGSGMKTMSVLECDGPYSLFSLFFL
ncbi:hypothetical protein CEP52_011581 [Fusarium oligoseptatum]|uniref:F-box domain-containing protein n=1 Tax=Fusarium oligoseptatum TaxID=2604345 RepID=A0A428T2E8_9HYPO|nr:hypothetical protein CEP52_011581 [Fusarium oligoseptatum]